MLENAQSIIAPGVFHVYLFKYGLLKSFNMNPLKGIKKGYYRSL